ncbi:MAG: ribbon-helix-helix protein, CopG family [Stenomitos rutilans HA7619-LM2]|nr:ribbon-helix-helix protein, CopG family [Stenomitos rutilans HA7619-LM2]
MPKIGRTNIEHLNVRLPISEMETLRRYCEETQRSQTDVIREFIRSLKPIAVSSDNPKAS